MLLIDKLVEIMVDFSLNNRELMHSNSFELVKEFESSVPKSSIINNSQSKICEVFPFSKSENLSNNALADL